jgi:hypothetical protein
MIDKEWLERVSIAYAVYLEKVGPNLAIEQFIKWLYREYGIIQPPESKK